MTHSNDSMKELQHTLITANHILHYHNVVDAYGHISFRHPTESSIFIMSNSVAPAIVSSTEDLVQYHVSDCSPCNPKAKKGYSERFIHGELYKKFSEINCVIHSHAEAVLPFTMNGVPLRPAFHIPGFLGTSVPNYDISKLYEPCDTKDLLVNQERFGAALADHFINSSNRIAGSQSPDKAVVLMKNHGFTAVGANIPQAVYRAIYTQVNARVQTNALMLRSAFLGNINAGQDDSESAMDGLQYLDEEQVEGCSKMAEDSQDRPWGLWVREVGACPLYVNKA